MHGILEPFLIGLGLVVVGGALVFNVWGIASRNLDRATGKTEDERMETERWQALAELGIRDPGRLVGGIFFIVGIVELIIALTRIF